MSELYSLPGIRARYPCPVPVPGTRARYPLPDTRYPLPDTGYPVPDVRYPKGRVKMEIEMKALSAALVVMTALTSVASGQQPTVHELLPSVSLRAQSSTARTLLDLEDGWAKAVVRRDVAYFRRMLAPGFVYTEDATVMTADDVIKGATGPDRVEFAGNEGMKVHDFGNTAVVTGILIIRGRGKDGAFNHRYRFTDTWQKRAGRWQIIAAQDYLIPK